MSVYELDIKSLRKTFQKFHKTLYGRTVFFLAYIIPFILLMIGLVETISGFIQGCPIILGKAIHLLEAFGVVFILANIYFYSEIRRFCEYEEKKKK